MLEPRVLRYPDVMLGLPNEWKDVGAIATSFGVLYALFRDHYLAWRKRPIFDIRFEPHPPDFHRDHTSQDVKYRLMMYVKNKGKSPVEDVQVVAEELWARPTPLSPYQKRDLFLPMALVWPFELQPTGNGTTTAKRIPPGTGQHCSLGHLMKFDGKVMLSLSLAASDLALREGHYRLKVRVSGSNAKAFVRFLEFRIEGIWYDTPDEIYAKAITWVNVVTQKVHDRTSKDPPPK